MLQRPPDDPQVRLRRSGAGIPAKAALSRSPALRQRLIPFALLVAAVTAAIYLPALALDFVIWDDDIHVIRNPYLDPVTPSHVLFFWTHRYLAEYVPLSDTAFAVLALSARVPPGAPSPSDTGARFDPRVFHAANIFLHAGNAVLVFVILYLLVRRRWAAVAGALLFALHPIQVESVAWVSELRGVLSAFFGLLAILLFLLSRSEDDEKPSRFLWGGSLLAALLALFSKSTAVVLPFVLFSIERWCVGRRARASALHAAPFLALAIPFALTIVHVQPVKPELIAPVWQRVFVAGDALAFYIRKLFLPVHFVIDYGRRPAAVLSRPIGYLTVILPAAVAVLVWRSRKRTPWLAGAALVSLSSLLPVLGLLPFSFQYFSTVADRYAYLFLLGPAIAAAYVSTLTHARQDRPASVVGIVVLTVLAIFTNRQIAFWKTTLTLIGHSLEINPKSDVLQCNLGIALVQRGRIPEALRRFEQSLAINPGNAMARGNVGNVLLLRERPADAETQYRLAIHADPGYAPAWSGLAASRATRGDFAHADRYYRVALQIDPNLKGAQTGLRLAEAKLAEERVRNAR